MTKESKLSSARTIIGGYNAVAGDKNQIDIDKFESDLQKLGAVTEESMAQCSWEDLTNECSLPKLLAKQIAAVFRKGDDTEETTYVSSKKAAKMTFEELFRCYRCLLYTSRCV